MIYLLATINIIIVTLPFINDFVVTGSNKPACVRGLELDPRKELSETTTKRDNTVRRHQIQLMNVTEKLYSYAISI